MRPVRVLAVLVFALAAVTTVCGIVAVSLLATYGSTELVKQLALVTVLGAFGWVLGVLGMETVQRHSRGREIA